MDIFIIQKMQLKPHPMWVDVKITRGTAEAAIKSLNNYSHNNPTYQYRLVVVLYTTRSPLK